MADEKKSAEEKRKHIIATNNLLIARREVFAAGVAAFHAQPPVELSARDKVSALADAIERATVSNDRLPLLEDKVKVAAEWRKFLNTQKPEEVVAFLERREIVSLVPELKNAPKLPKNSDFGGQYLDDMAAMEFEAQWAWTDRLEHIRQEMKNAAQEKPGWSNRAAWEAAERDNIPPTRREMLQIAVISDAIQKAAKASGFMDPAKAPPSGAKDGLEPKTESALTRYLNAQRRELKLEEVKETTERLGKIKASQQAAPVAPSPQPDPETSSRDGSEKPGHGLPDIVKLPKATPRPQQRQVHSAA